jgi:2'-hydroxyisoflavone reductase
MATIIRPGLIVGPGDETDRFTYWPVRIDRGGDVLAPGDGADPVQYIDARDLAEWTIRMAERGTTGVFNATGPARQETMREMLDGIRSALHADAHITWVPGKFLNDNNVSPWMDMPVWVLGNGGTAGFARRSINRALADGLTYRPLAETARDTLAWFKTQPADRQAKLRAGLTPDREAALLAKWNAEQAKG